MSHTVFLVCSSTRLIGQGVAAVLIEAPDLTIVGRGAWTAETLDAIATARPDVGVLEADTIRTWESWFIRQFHERSPKTSILTITSDDDPEVACTALEAGAVGYVLTDIEPAGLVQAVRNVAEGKAMLNPRITRKLLPRLIAAVRTQTGAASHNLTTREIQVLVALSQGYSDRDIAAQLFLSEATVKTHVKAVYRKLKLRNRAHAAAFAATHELDKLTREPWLTIVVWLAVTWLSGEASSLAAKWLSG